jgi:hypothetical protein
LDLLVEVGNVGVFPVDEDLDAVAGLLEFHLDDVHVFDLGLGLALGELLALRLLLPVETNASH